MNVDAFTRAYIDCIYFTSAGPDDDIPEDAELSPEALARIISECADFQSSNVEALTICDAASAGHDFWLTRNRHGAGFWDRGLGAVGRYLTERSHACGSVDVYAGDDGMIYLS